MIQKGTYKEIKKDPLSKIIREDTNVINSSKLIIEKMFKFFIQVSNLQYLNNMLYQKYINWDTT